MGTFNLNIVGSSSAILALTMILRFLVIVVVTPLLVAVTVSVVVLLLLSLLLLLLILWPVRIQREMLYSLCKISQAVIASSRQFTDMPNMHHSERMRDSGAVGRIGSERG